MQKIDKENLIKNKSYTYVTEFKMDVILIRIIFS